VAHEEEGARVFLQQRLQQLEGDARWKEYAGGYEDWKRASRNSPSPKGEGASSTTPSPQPSPKGEGARGAKLSYKESRELEGLPAAIEALEVEQADLARRLADPASYTDRSTDIKAVNIRHAEIEQELDRLMRRWDELEALTRRGKP